MFEVVLWRLLQTLLRCLSKLEMDPAQGRLLTLNIDPLNGSSVLKRCNRCFQNPRTLRGPNLEWGICTRVGSLA